MRAVTATLMVILLVLRDAAWAASAAPLVPMGDRGAEFPPAANDPVARRCDLLANLPIDAQKVGAGVAFERINAAEAIPACEQAATSRPLRARYQFLYGRALEAGKRYPEAIQQYSLAGQAGYAPASSNLARLHAEGLGVPKNAERAVQLYSSASQGGYAPAAHALALHYFTGIGVPQSSGRAAELYRQAATLGLPESALVLGRLYQAGEGVPRDQGEANKWFEKAGDGGVGEGYTLLADNIFEYSGRFSEAVAWYRRGAEGGSGYASHQLAWFYEHGAGGRHPKDAAMAAKLYAVAAAKGIPEAMVNLGQLYREGRGVAKDPAAAYRWFLEAARQQQASRPGRHWLINSARWEVGSMLYEGVGVARDARAAFPWLLSAAKGEPLSFPNHYAQQLLGVMYLAGDGVASDPREAVAWFDKAARANHPFAMTQLGMHLRQGVGVAGNETEAMQWFRKAADRGFAAAESALGYGYMSALGGGARDYPQAAFWLERAARQGDASAQINLGALYANGWGVSRDMEKAKALWSRAAASPIPQYAELARRNLRDDEDQVLARAQARFAERRGARPRDDPDAAAKVVALVIGGAFLLSLLSSGSGKGSGGAARGGSLADYAEDNYMREQQQRQLDDAIGRLARSGTRDCYGKVGCASQ